MEIFCEKGKIEKKGGYNVCRGEDRNGDLRYDLTLIYAKDRNIRGHSDTTTARASPNFLR